MACRDRRPTSFTFRCELVDEQSALSTRPCRRLYSKVVHKKGALQIAQPFSSTIIADLEKLLGEDCNGTRKHSRSEYQIRDYR